MGPFKTKRNTKKIVLLISGISAAVLALAAFLLQLIYFGNKPVCEQMYVGVGLLGCQARESYVYDKIAIVVGNTQNSPKPTLDEEEKLFIANSSYKHKVQISLYSASSERSSISFDNPTIRDDEEQKKLSASILKRIDAIEEAIQKEPKGNGAQYLDTIIEAQKKIASKKSQKLLIIVIGSGLSDGGILDFTQGDLLHRDPDAAIEERTKSGDIIYGRLSDTDVYWSGIGAVTSPQAKLTEQESNNLKSLYENALTEMGAEIIDLSEGVEKNDGSVETTFTVTPIPTEGYECVWCVTKTFDSDTIGFSEHSSDINDRNAVKNQLQGLIDEMKRNSAETVNITGFVSLIKHDCSISLDRNIDHSLALNRAEAIKRFLIEEGISGDRIIANDGGHGPENECAGGRFNEDVAKKNMIITIKASA